MDGLFGSLSDSGGNNLRGLRVWDRVFHLSTESIVKFTSFYISFLLYGAYIWLCNNLFSESYVY